jgi:hypothetical protein
MAPTKADKADDADESLKRLGGGRWQTRDERFTIEPESGTWAVVDAEATDDLGLPLVRGPFRSLTDAKAAIAAARAGEPPASPLRERVERGREPAPAKAAQAEHPKPARAEQTALEAKPARSTGAKRSTTASAELPSKGREEPAADPSWFRDLDPGDRGRARRLIEQLTGAGVGDAESIVRRDLAGGVPALAAHAIAVRLAALADAATPEEVARLLADGRDEALGVRWRIVDGDGRPIVIERTATARRR